MKQIVIVSDHESGQLDSMRCSAFLNFLERKSVIQGEKLVSGDLTTRGGGRALKVLADKGLLSFAAGDEGIDVTYVPSAGSNRKIALASDGLGFPMSIHEKQVAAFRTSKGAIFRLPCEHGSGALEIFITDWSPCPAACAVAIHRYHSFIAGQRRPEGPFFTGRFVRHPLTGDLLPVWVADWVKADFGTGAVLVNPAHDLADLRFGRQVGLPIRFGLAPSGFDGEPGTWPQPPIIKYGKTIKTGFYDGLTVAEAIEEYFQVLDRRGLAERYTDYQAGALRLAQLVPDETSSLVWDPQFGQLAEKSLEESLTSSEAHRVRVAGSGLFEALLVLDELASVSLVATVASKTSELLFLRLLQEDLRGEPLRVDDIVLVHRTQPSKAEANEQILLLASLVSSPADQVAVLKQQIIEQIQRFLRLHQKLLDGKSEEGSGEMDERGSKIFKKIKEGILLCDPPRAFTQLSALQKQLAEQGETESEALRKYFVLAHTLLGFEVPFGIDARQVWTAI
jgi:leucyl-tRNA synthetase